MVRRSFALVRRSCLSIFYGVSRLKFGGANATPLPTPQNSSPLPEAFPKLRKRSSIVFSKYTGVVAAIAWAF